MKLILFIYYIMNNIINPLTGIKYNLFSEEGKTLLKNYVNFFQNGGGVQPMLTGDWIDKINKNIEARQKSPVICEAPFLQTCGIYNSPSVDGEYAHKVASINSGTNIKDHKDLRGFVENGRCRGKPLDISPDASGPLLLEFTKDGEKGEKRYVKVNKLRENEKTLDLSRGSVENNRVNYCIDNAPPKSRHT
jgi:hypothetical protein